MSGREDFHLILTGGIPAMPGELQSLGSGTFFGHGDSLFSITQ
jgi:hypothetical protein